MPEKVDQQIYDMFLRESLDSFEALNRDLLELERNPSSEKVLYSIMRIIHSLKGSAGMIHFERFQEMCHKAEDFMEIIHARPDAVDHDVMDLLFLGSDAMQGLFNRSMKDLGQAGVFTDLERAFLDKLADVGERITTGAFDLEASLEGFLEQASDLIASVGDIYDASEFRKSVEAFQRYLDMRKSASEGEGTAVLIFDGQDVSESFQAVKSKLGAAERNVLETEDVETLFKELETLLDAVEKGCEELRPEIQEARENITLFHELELDFDALQAELYSQLIEEIASRAAREEAREVERVVQGDAAKSGGGVASFPAMSTVRVEEGKIDAFLDKVGEMIILGELFNNLEKRFAAKLSGGNQLNKEFRTANKTFSSHVFSLQRALMDVRRVELRNVTGGLGRLVRDTAAKLNKKVAISISGEDAVIDKSHLDDVKTALIHLVRNAVDHGVESSDERVAKGKSAESSIRVDACNELDSLIVKVSDDGRGIDPEALRRKAVEKGLLGAAEAEEMAEDELRQLVFKDGFSTATEVSDVSGRGVGMSVVIDNVRKMGGDVDVASEVGSGTTVTLRVPLSVMLSVTDAFIVAIAGERFALPIQNVIESFSPRREDFIDMQGRGECVRLRDATYRLLRLDSALGLENGEPARGAGGICILIDVDEERFCVFVDDIVDHQQIVIKDVEGLSGLAGILGGALLGDGRVGMVLDIESFALARGIRSSALDVERSARNEASLEGDVSCVDVAELDSTMDSLEDSNESTAVELAPEATVDSTLPSDPSEWRDRDRLVDILEEMASGCFVEMRESLLMNEIEDFAKRLKELGATHGVVELESYGERLLEIIASFRVDDLPDALGFFPSLLDAVRTA